MSEFCISHQDKHSQHFAKIRAGSVFKYCLSDDHFEKDNQALANYSSSLPSSVFVIEPEEKPTHFIIYDFHWNLLQSMHFHNSSLRRCSLKNTLMKKELQGEISEGTTTNYVTPCIVTIDISFLKPLRSSTLKKLMWFHFTHRQPKLPDHKTLVFKHHLLTSCQTVIHRMSLGNDALEQGNIKGIFWASHLQIN